MDRDNEIELVQTIQEKDKRIKELETINENITRELLSRTEKLDNLVEERLKSKDIIDNAIEIFRHKGEFSDWTHKEICNYLYGFNKCATLKDKED